MVWVVLILIIGDLLFIALHIAFKLDLVSSELCNLSRDRGYAEMFQYAKLFLIVVGLLIQCKQVGRPTHFAWCFAFAYLLIDDGFRVHENAGPFLANHFTLPLHPDHLESVGELVATGIFGALILIFVGFAYRNTEKSERKTSQRLLCLLVILFLRGVVIDAGHTWVDKRFRVKTLSGFLGIMQDGGEMVVISIVCGYVLSMPHRNGIGRTQATKLHLNRDAATVHAFAEMGQQFTGLDS